MGIIQAPVPLALIKSKSPRPLFVGHRGQIMGQYSDVLGSPNNFTRFEGRHLFKLPPVAVAGIQPVWPGWKYSNGQQGISNAFNLDAVAEVDGSPIRLPFDNNISSFTMTSGVTKFGDRLPITFAASTVIPIRTQCTVSAGQTIPSGLQISASGEACYASNAASQTFGTGPLSLPSGGTTLDRGYGPMALIGTPADPATPAFFLWTDSIGQGLSDTIAGDSNGNYGPYERGLWNSWRGGTPGQYRAVRAGDTLSLNTRVNSIYKRWGLQYATDAICALGNNDAAGSSVSTIKSRLLENWAACAAYGVRAHQALLLPRTTSTDGWTTAVGQTPASGYEPGGTRDQINTWIRTQVGVTIASIIDLNTLYEDQNTPGVWATNGNQNYLTADGTHPYGDYSNAAGGDIVRAWVAAHFV